MFRYLLLFILSYLTTFVTGQKTVKEYVTENQVQITTIDPNSNDFSDLEALKFSIGSSRVIMLGEQDHGDALTFNAKTRLVKFLHERMGFNVLAFECDFFALNEGFDKSLNSFIEKPQLIDSFTKGNIYSIWTGCDATKYLFNNYVPSTYTTNKPLLLTGFDNQLYLQYSANHLSIKLDSVFHVNKLPVTREPYYTSTIRPLLDSLKYMIYWKRDTTAFNNCLRLLIEIKGEMELKLSKNDFWNVVLDNLIMECEQFKLDNNRKYIPKSFNFRDNQMAHNLYWITNVKYKSQKIIVWAANFHISKFSGHYKDKMLNQYQSMGTVFSELNKMHDSTYILGFTSYGGIAGRVGSSPYKLDLPNSNSFENWLPREWEYSFVDLKKLNSSDKFEDEMFYLSGDRHRSQKAIWNKVFDGVFYIKTMIPCK